MDTAAKKPRLLIVEDNADTRQIYKDVFEREGFQVLLAEDGEKGLSYAQATLPEAILLDVMLPKLNGFDLLQRLRDAEETRNIPVMIFSAMGDSADRQKAAALGVTEYSVKAFNPPKQVVSRVRALIAKSQQPAQSSIPDSAYQIGFKESAYDAARLQSDMGISKGFQCPECRSEIVLSMIPDPTRAPGHWFATHFHCLKCQRVL